MSRLIIVEGCDGSGKTTLIEELLDCSALAGARSIHYGNIPNANRSLPRFYLEGMLPAINDDCPIILDRCWLSEEPYGHAYRGGKLRFEDPEARMLERVALTVGAVVIHCDPGLDHCTETFLSRKGDEYLDDVAQVKHVYKRYITRMKRCHLPVFKYNFYRHNVEDVVNFILDAGDNNDLLANVPGAGNPSADFVMVGDQYGNHTDQDAWQQFPFVSFGAGCSKWLASGLDQFNIPEADLYWTNANLLEPALGYCAEADIFDALKGKMIFALGDVANNTLQQFGFKPVMQHHPSYWRRFQSGKTYPLLTDLAEMYRE